MERKGSSGFRRIFPVAFDWLFYVKLGYVNVYRLGNWAEGLEHPARAKKGKSYSENTPKHATSFPSHDPVFFP